MVKDETAIMSWYPTVSAAKVDALFNGSTAW